MQNVIMDRVKEVEERSWWVMVARWKVVLDMFEDGWWSTRDIGSIA